MLLYFHLQESPSLVFTDWLWKEIHSINLARDSETFLDFFYEYACSAVLVLFCGRILKLVYFLLILQNKGEC